MLLMPFRRVYLVIVSLIFICNTSIAQNSIHLLPKSSSIRVFGTSNVYDWELYVELQKKTPNYKIPNNSIKDLKNILFKIDGHKLKSKENAMEKMAHKKLNLSSFPHISFLLKEITIKNYKTTSFNALAIGTFLVSGQQKDVILPINGNFIGNKKMNLTGHIDLKLSDFKIDLPSAFFGLVSADDEIKILYSLDFASKKKLTEDMLSFNLTP